MGEEAGTPSSFSASCCCCSPPCPPSPPEFSSEATVCSSPGSRFVATLNLVQLRHLVRKICRRRRGGLRSERKRGEACKPNPPIWPVEELLKCLSESEALLVVGGTPWVKEYGRRRGGRPPRPGWRQGLATKHTCNNTLKGVK